MHRKQKKKTKYNPKRQLIKQNKLLLAKQSQMVDETSKSVQKQIKTKAKEMQRNFCIV